jgi:hypothetical protein
MPAYDARTHCACGSVVLARRRWFFAICRVVTLVSGLTSFDVGRAADAKPEVIFQLPLAPSGLTIMPDGGFLISVSFEEKPQNRVIAVGRAGESKPFPNTSLSQAAAGEALQMDAIMGMQGTDNGIVWMLDNGRRSEHTPKIIAWDSGHARLQHVFHLAPPAVLSSSTSSIWRRLRSFPDRCWMT